MSKPCCPECGSSLSIDPKCVIDEPYFPRPMYRHQALPRRNRVAPVAFCTGCEFTIEIGSKPFA